MKVFRFSLSQTLSLCAATLIISALPLLSAAQDKIDDEVIKVDTNLVVINAVVTDAKGNPVSGLRLSDFKVFENGVEQELMQDETVKAGETLLDIENIPFAAVILFDTSGSMETRIAVARSAAIKFLEGLREEDYASVYNFDSKVKLVQEFSASRDLSPMAYNIKADGWTVLNDAIVEASKVLVERPEKRRAIIVLSDGADTKSKASSEIALKDALAANALIYTVDISALDKDRMTQTQQIERRQSVGALKKFAENSGGRFIPVAGGPALREAFQQVIQELGAQYTISYQPKNLVSDGKWRSIEVRVTRPNLTVRARKGYNAPKVRK